MLPHILRANAMSCSLFGAVFAFAAPWTAEFVGTPPVLLLQILGVGLLLNAGALFWTSLRRRPNKLIVQLFAMGDFMWVLATVVILIGGFWITTSGGTIWAVCIAAFVGVCGALQWKFAPQ